ncbi:hypothetical protein MMC15_001265 [Xylographa vitiligo]|nr:hypothetical protein [Xylographa vitiligo]
MAAEIFFSQNQFRIREAIYDTMPVVPGGRLLNFLNWLPRIALRYLSNIYFRYHAYTLTCFSPDQTSWRDTLTKIAQITDLTRFTLVVDGLGEHPDLPPLSRYKPFSSEERAMFGECPPTRRLRDLTAELNEPQVEIFPYCRPLSRSAHIGDANILFKNDDRTGYEFCRGRTVWLGVKELSAANVAIKDEAGEEIFWLSRAALPYQDVSGTA